MCLDPDAADSPNPAARPTIASETTTSRYRRMAASIGALPFDRVARVPPCSAAAPLGAVAVARAVVEAVAKDRGITTGNLKSKIDSLHSQGHITASMRDAATEIRFAGNDAAHGDL